MTDIHRHLAPTRSRSGLSALNSLTFPKHVERQFGLMTKPVEHTSKVVRVTNTTAIPSTLAHTPDNACALHNPTKDTAYTAIIDSGACESLTPSDHIFTTPTRPGNIKSLTSASGHPMHTTGMGDVNPYVVNVLHCPDATATLVSTARLAQAGVGCIIPPGNGQHSLLYDSELRILGIVGPGMRIDIRNIRPTGDRLDLKRLFPHPLMSHPTATMSKHPKLAPTHTFPPQPTAVHMVTTPPSATSTHRPTRGKSSLLFFRARDDRNSGFDPCLVDHVIRHIVRVNRSKTLNPTPPASPQPADPTLELPSGGAASHSPPHTPIMVPTSGGDAIRYTPSPHISRHDTISPLDTRTLDLLLQAAHAGARLNPSTTPPCTATTQARPVAGGGPTRIDYVQQYGYDSDDDASLRYDPLQSSEWWQQPRRYAVPHGPYLARQRGTHNTGWHGCGPKYHAYHARMRSATKVRTSKRRHLNRRPRVPPQRIVKEDSNTWWLRPQPLLLLQEITTRHRPHGHHTTLTGADYLHSLARKQLARLRTHTNASTLPSSSIHYTHPNDDTCTAFDDMPHLVGEEDSDDEDVPQLVADEDSNDDDDCVSPPHSSHIHAIRTQDPQTQHTAMSLHKYGWRDITPQQAVHMAIATFCVSKSELMFMASGTIINFPVSVESIMRHWQPSPSLDAAFLHRRQHNNSRYTDPSVATDLRLYLRRRFDAPSNAPPVAIGPLPRLTPERSVVGHTVSIDFVSIYDTYILFATCLASGFSHVFPATTAGKQQLPALLLSLLADYKRAGHRIHVLRSDSEAINTTPTLLGILDNAGITQRLSPPYEKEFNGSIEKTIDNIKCRATAMMNNARHLNPNFIVGAITHACDVHNLRPTRIPGRRVTRHESFHGSPPDLASYIFAPYGHPTLFHLPRVDDPKQPFSRNALVGVYFGASRRTPGAVEVYNVQTRHVTFTGSYRFLAEVPSYWYQWGPSTYTLQPLRENEGPNRHIRPSRDTTHIDSDGPTNRSLRIPSFNLPGPPDAISSPRTASTPTRSAIAPTVPSPSSHNAIPAQGPLRTPAQPAHNSLPLPPPVLRPLRIRTMTQSSDMVPQRAYGIQKKRQHLTLQTICLPGQSSLAGAGRGLFATQMIQAGTIFAHYTGMTIHGAVAIAEAAMIHDTIMMIDDDTAIIGRGMAALINDNADSDSINAYSEVVQTMQLNGTKSYVVTITALRDIPPTAEIFMSYGDTYWDNTVLPDGKKFVRTTPTTPPSQLLPTSPIASAMSDDQLPLPSHKLTSSIAPLSQHSARADGDNPTIKQARSRDDWPQWQTAIDAELTQMVTDKVWEIWRGGFPPGATLLGSMMVLQLKRLPSGAPDKYKARLVALGNQQPSNSYAEIKSSMARSISVKLILSWAPKQIQAHLSVIDIKGAYLKSSVTADDSNIFLRLHDGQWVRLLKYLYGLKQAGYHWQQNITTFLLSKQFLRLTTDENVFILRQAGAFIALVLHVDDLLVVSTSDQLRLELIAALRLHYGEVSIKTGAELPYLGLLLHITDHSVSINQPGLIDKLGALHLPSSNKRHPSTPLSVPSRINSDTTQVIDTPTSVADTSSSVPISPLEYLAVVGGINYLTQFSRPDCYYALSVVAQKCSKPTRSDFNLCLRILAYLIDTRHVQLTFNRTAIQPVFYADAAFNCYPDARSHYGYIGCLAEGDGSFIVDSKKTTVTALSSTEAEIIGCCECVRTVVWVRRLLAELGTPISAPTVVYQDNMSTIQWIQGHRNFRASRHVNPKLHFAGDMIDAGEVELRYLSTTQMVADILTKPLAAPQHYVLASQLLNYQLRPFEFSTSSPRVE